MDKETIINTIKSLRRDYNPDLFGEFKVSIVQNIMEVLSEYSLRDIISIVDTYIDYGDIRESRNAMIISTFFNVIKIADTAMLLKNGDDSQKERLLQDVMYLYDGCNTIRIAYDDMPSVLFFRINELLKSTPVLQVMFESVVQRLRKNSETLKIAEYNPKFYDKEFFPGRKNCLGLEYPDNQLVKQLKF